MLQWFDISTQIMLFKDYDLNPSKQKFLRIGAQLLFTLAITINFKINTKYNKFEYPYDFIGYYMICGIGC